MKIIAKNKAGFILQATPEEVAMITGNSPASLIADEGDEIQVGALYNQLIRMKDNEVALAAAKQTLTDVNESLDTVTSIVKAVADEPV